MMIYFLPIKLSKIPMMWLMRPSVQVSTVEWLWRGTDDTQSSPYGSISGVAFWFQPTGLVFLFSVSDFRNWPGSGDILYICIL
jgi:hypothetical protein